MSLQLPTTTHRVGAEPTMSSREIADLLNSRHDSVKRTFERLVEKGLIRFTPSVETSHEGAGARDVEVYRVNKRDSYVVVAQLSPEFTARLVDRWQELEAAAATPSPDFSIPRTLSEALRLAADQADRLSEQEAKLALMAPKAEFHDLVASAVNTQDMLTVAKALGTGRTRLFKLLRQRSILMENNLPYQQFVDDGYFRVIELRPWTDSDGNSHAAFKTVVTGKGITFLQRVVASAGPATDVTKSPELFPHP